MESIYDDATRSYDDVQSEAVRKNYVCGDLAEETRLPRELIERLHEMWARRERPFFTSVAEDGTISPDDLAELIRSLKIHSDLLCRSISRVISAGAPIGFAQFVRGYGWLHARTLREALPFAFKVFDLDGDGKLKTDEFGAVLDASLTLNDLDPTAIKKVRRQPPSPSASASTRSISKNMWLGCQRWGRVRAVPK